METCATLDFRETFLAFHEIGKRRNSEHTVGSEGSLIENVSKAKVGSATEAILAAVLHPARPVLQTSSSAILDASDVPDGSSDTPEGRDGIAVEASRSSMVVVHVVKVANVDWSGQAETSLRLVR